MENPEKPSTHGEAGERAANEQEVERRPEGTETARSAGEALTADKAGTEASVSAPAAATRPEGKAPVQKDARRMQVERILENDLWEVFRDLPAAARGKFKERGEELAAEMRDGLADPKVAAGKVYEDVIEWLKTIPHVNRHFLTQSAKIKTDKWVDLRADVMGEPAQGLEEL